MHTHIPPAVQHNESIASEGKGEYMYVEGYVRDTSGAPIPGAVIETWEADGKGEAKYQVPFHRLPRTDSSGVPQKGLYDAQYADRVVPDCRGRFVTDKGGKYGYRAVVPVAYAITEGVSFFLSFFLFFGVINPTPLGPRIPIRARSMNSF